MEHEGDAIRLEILEMAGLGIKDMQLFSKRDQVQIGELLTAAPEFPVEILTVGNELFDQVLHIHNKSSLSSRGNRMSATKLVLLCAAFDMRRPGENPGWKAGIWPWL
jgi:hypothetical protein